jgi:hypothetical protein
MRTDMYEPVQKVLQSLVIWLLPLLGAVSIAHFLNDRPVVLSEKASKYVLILKFLFMPFVIKIKSNLDDSIGNSTEGYEAGGY